MPLPKRGCGGAGPGSRRLPRTQSGVSYTLSPSICMTPWTDTTVGHPFPRGGNHVTAAVQQLTQESQQLEGLVVYHQQDLPRN